jgi:hypothetical protein
VTVATDPIEDVLGRRSNSWPITGFYVDATVANPRLPTCREAGSSLITRYCHATTAYKPVQFHTRPPNPMSVTRTLTSNNHNSANLICHSFQIVDALPTPPAPSKTHPPVNFVIFKMCSCSTAIDHARHTGIARPTQPHFDESRPKACPSYSFVHQAVLPSVGTQITRRLRKPRVADEDQRPGSTTGSLCPPFSTPDSNIQSPTTENRLATTVKQLYQRALLHSSHGRYKRPRLFTCRSPRHP